jgi:N-methylhydantoinase A
MPASGYSVGVDIGGTFTDFVGFNLETNEIVVTKSRTTPRELTGGVMGCFKKSRVLLSAVESLFHGTTVVVNSIIERKGARTALVTTLGFRDVLEIGRGNRPSNYALGYDKPAPLVPRGLRFEVRERMAPDGSVVQPISMEDLDAIIEAVEKHRIESLAICFLHSYANPAHEEKAREYLQSVLPELYICTSAEVAREWREFERSSTTVLNAFVGPKVEDYVGQLESNAKQQGFSGRFYLMQSSGGLMTSQRARRYPVGLVESGPVAGMMGAAHVGTLARAKLVIGFDMGGTTAKASVIQDGEPQIAQTCYVDGYGGGYPLQIPTVDIIEVGTGGGSLAWVDDLGALKVGPRSAGSEPGPVCFGAGGTEPTVTDANVILGRINADRYLGGEMALDVQAAVRAVQDKIAKPLGISLEAAATGILAIANSNMALAVRTLTMEKGVDPKQATLVAFGGGGPLQASAVARELGIPRVIVPTYPSCFSALGMLLADVRHDIVRTCLRPLPSADYTEINRILGELRNEAFLRLQSSGTAGRNAESAAHLDLRYQGQQWTLTVPVGGDYISAEDATEIRSTFDKMYEARFGHAFPDTATEVVNVRFVATGRQRKPRLPILRGRAGGAPKAEMRRVHFDEAGVVECPVYRREELLWRDRVAGPALIEENNATTIIGVGDVAIVSEHGFISMQIKDGKS